MFAGPIYFGTFFWLGAHLMANIRINVDRSHLLWHIFLAAGTPYGKYPHQCSQVPSTLALFFCCGHTLWQIRASMFSGPIYFRTFSLLRAHLMANIHINVYRPHLLLRFLFALCTPYAKYLHRCLQVPSTFAVFLCYVHTLKQIFTSMLTGPIYFCSFSLLRAHLIANMYIDAYRSVGTHYNKYSHQCSQVLSTLTVFLCCAHTL